MPPRPCIIPGCTMLTQRGSRCTAHSLRSDSAPSWRTLRTTILDRDNRTCQTCGNYATHIDHIQPISRGGTNHPSNLRALCAHCNQSKGART